MASLLYLITAHFYQAWAVVGQAWAVVGPLVGVLLGAWLTARWQRNKWILDNKTAEYRGILDVLNSYRFTLGEYYALYKVAMVAVAVQKKYDDIALAKSMGAVSNAFADRIFTYLAVQKSGARNDWTVLAGMIKADKSTVDDLFKVIDRIHNTLVRVARDDLHIQGGLLTWLRSKVKGR